MIIGTVAKLGYSLTNNIFGGRKSNVNVLSQLSQLIALFSSVQFVPIHK